MNTEPLKLFYAFVVGLIIGGGMCYLTSAHAMTIRGDPGKCAALAEDTATVANLRDMGYQWTIMEGQFRKQGKEVIGKPDSYIADVEDFEETMQVFKFAFVNGLTPYETARAVYKICMDGRRAT